MASSPDGLISARDAVITETPGWEVGRWGGHPHYCGHPHCRTQCSAGGPEVPQHMRLTTIPHDALVIGRDGSCGGGGGALLLKTIHVGRM